MEEQKIQDQERRARERRLRRRIRFKNRIILLETALIIALAVALIIVSIGYFDLKNTSDGPDASISGVGSTASDTGSANSESSGVNSGTSSDLANDEQLKMKAELDKWYMKLVNPDNYVDAAYIDATDRSAIDSKYIVSSTKETCKYLDSRIIEYFEDMCKAAADDGIVLVSVSAYRSISYQTGLYNNRVDRCIREDGLSREAAANKAATIVAVPGTSEHHLGLAVDINSVETSFENTAAFRWLQTHAEDYGFIMRYPKDKQDITKIIYEPWHYRYVGVEHAKAMNDLGMCMEEYVEYLSSGVIEK